MRGTKHGREQAEPGACPTRCPSPGGLLLALLASAAAACAAPAGFKVAELEAMDTAIVGAIAGNQLPGGVLWLEHDGAVHHGAYGHRALLPEAETATADTVYDVASLTKVMATTIAVMQLAERGQLELDAPVARYLPDFAQGGKAHVTVRQVLTHHSGLKAGLSLDQAWSGTGEALALACAEPLRNVPGSTFIYSDINFIVLGELVGVAGGRRLDAHAEREIFGPLTMRDTCFLPPVSLQPRIAPTESADGRMLRGIVHDPTARRMGGVAGHAGLFSTAADVARFCRMLLGGGELEGIRVLRAASVAEMTRLQTDGSDRRGLGWDIDSRHSGPRGSWFPAGRSYGHTGWTGASAWIDPESRSFVVFLSNRVHPGGTGDILPLRAAIGTHAAAAIGRDRDAVLNGIDVLVRDDFAPLRGLTIGLITNHTGRDRQGRSTIDLLHAAPGVTLACLFAPEHGIRGISDDHVGDTVDQKTGLPVYSLYGNTPRRAEHQSTADYDLAVIRARVPKPEHLRGLDALVFDIQDIGARFYTYASTLGAALEAAGRERKKFFVLDRVNPISGGPPEGPVQTRHASFTGFHPIPVRHGLTLGELARLFNAERGFGADLAVIACENWKRDQWFDETGLPWVNPSPSMRSLTAATLYPGFCLLEGTSVSMGRGTLLPFEQVGAPYVDGERLAAVLNRAGLQGVRFEPVTFTPNPELFPGPAHALKHRDQACGGIRAVLTDRTRCNGVDIGLELALTLNRLHPAEFNVGDMARLLGHDETITAIGAGETRGQIKARWAAGLAEFAKRSQPVLLYRP
ncbi:MAG: exo-beta-N-acetylmuramidase NamZ domain-containing protein [Opitutus sp.]